MTERDYDDLVHHLHHPRRSVISDWPRFIRPLPGVPEAPPVHAWKQGPDHLAEWLDAHTGHVQRLVIMIHAAERGLPDWTEFATSSDDLREAVRLAPDQALWQLRRWLRGDDDQRTLVIRQLESVHRLVVEALDSIRDRWPDRTMTRAVAVIESAAHPSHLCVSSESFPFAFDPERIAAVLHPMRDLLFAADGWRTASAALAFVDGLSTPLD